MENFISMLTVLFIGLKLTNFIDWSWWWVMSPMIFAGVCILVYILFKAHRLVQSKKGS